MVPEAMILGWLILFGCTFIATRLKKIGDEMQRANDLKEAELRGRDVAVTESGSAS